MGWFSNDETNNVLQNLHEEHTKNITNIYLGMGALAIVMVMSSLIYCMRRKWKKSVVKRAQSLANN